MNSLQKCLNEIQHAINEPGDAWRLAGLGTVDARGIPQARQVVLREVCPNEGHILIYTDRRSQKVTELQQQPACTLLLWCPARQQQLRLSCHARLMNDTSNHWSKIAGKTAVADYDTVTAPGEVLLAALQHDANSARDNFAVLVLQVKEIDRLWLSKQGHRRQRLSADSDNEITP